jgi:uncharacterized membrane protein
VSHSIGLTSAVMALVGGFLWLTLQTRVLMRGADIPLFDTTDAESWAYSVVWLLYGLALLAAGVITGSREARIASGIVVLLTVAKVFLVDLADLEGLWRALSFIGLGIALILIGLVYQRLVFAPKGSN